MLTRVCVAIILAGGGALAAAPKAAADPLLVAGFGDSQHGPGDVAFMNLTTGTTVYGEVPSYPSAVAIAPDGKTAWVGDQDAGVTPFNMLAPPGMGTRIGDVGNEVGGMAFTPDGHTMYVQDSFSTVPIDLTTDTPGQPIPVGSSIPTDGGAHQLAMSPDGTTLYATNQGPGCCAAPDQLVAIDVATNTPTLYIPLGGMGGDNAAGVVITPDGHTAYVALSESGIVVPVDLQSGVAESPISLPVAQLGGSGASAFDIAITPDGSTVYVSFALVNGGSYIVPIETATNTVGTAIPTPDTGGGDFLALSPDGKILYAAPTPITGGSTLLQIDVATNSISSTTTLPFTPRSFTIGSTTSPVMDPTSTGVSCSPNTVAVGQATTCTASVTDTSSSQTTPTGTVSFTSDTGGGTFSGSGSCTLSPTASTGQASCSVNYTAGQVGSGTHTITAKYGGDSTHGASSGSETVAVTAGILFAYSSSCSTQDLTVSGSLTTVSGGVHSNGTLVMSGSNNKFGTTTYGGPNHCSATISGHSDTFAGASTPTADPNVEPWPVDNRNSLPQCTYSATSFSWSTSGAKIPAGVYCASSQIQVSASNLTGNVTLIAPTIAFSGSNDNFTPYAQNLLAYQSGTSSLNVSGSDLHGGTIFAPNARIAISGSGGMVNGIVEGLYVTISGSSWTLQDLTG